MENLNSCQTSSQKKRAARNRRYYESQKRKRLFAVLPGENSDLVQSESEKEEESQKKNDIVQELGEWAVSHNVPESTLASLLEILKRNNESLDEQLPMDPRTVISRATTTSAFPVEEDHFVYLGIRCHLDEICATRPAEIVLNFSTDGMPLGSSKTRKFWPVFMTTPTVPGRVYVISVRYFDRNSPAVTVYLVLGPLLGELNQLLEHGFNGIQVKIGFITADLPAMALLKQIKGHAGYFSCYKCAVEGEYIHGSVRFPTRIALSAAVRTDDSFRNHHQLDHHLKIDDEEVIPSPFLGKYINAYFKARKRIISETLISTLISGL